MTYGVSGCIAPRILNPRHQMEVSGQIHADCFNPGERVPGTHWLGGWVGLRAGLDAVAKRKKKISAHAGNRTPVVQPVAYSVDWLRYNSVVATLINHLAWACSSDRCDNWCNRILAEDWEIRGRITLREVVSVEVAQDRVQWRTSVLAALKLPHASVWPDKNSCFV
jgi:hypothetical protein